MRFLSQSIISSQFQLINSFVSRSELIGKFPNKGEKDKKYKKPVRLLSLVVMSTTTNSLIKLQCNTGKKPFKNNHLYSL